MSKKTIWFLSRYYLPDNGGGIIARKFQVDYLQKYYNVNVVTVNYTGNTINVYDNIHYIPFYYFFLKVFILFESLGLLEDYLDIWIKKTYIYLENKIKDGDIVFSTTGGDLGCIKLGSLLKKRNKNIKFIVNYHDLLFYGIYEGEKISNKIHVKIDNLEKKYLSNCDHVISSSLVMKTILINKYGFLKEKSSHMYFGFNNMSCNKTIIKNNNTKIKIFYVGSMGKLQSPEIIIDALKGLDKNIRNKIEIYFIGNCNNNIKITKSNKIKKIDYMNRNDLIKLLKSEADYGFFSLVEKKSLKYAMPTKFYEYIGLDLPIIGALPKNSEVINLIKDNNIGLVVNYGDIDGLKKILFSIVNNREQINIFKNNIKKIKLNFDSKNTLGIMKEVIESL